MTDQDSVTYEKDGEGIATITLSRPDRLNAMNAAMGAALGRALDDVDADPEVRAVIVTGAGRAFCAGADLSSGAGAFTPLPAGSTRSARAASPERDWGGVLVLRLFAMTKPVIAAVNGASVGVGATMTLPCDVRLASSEARFGFVFARRGIVPDGCASWFLPRIVGIGTALKWCMTGRIVTADEAHAAGLVDAVHSPDDLLPAARELASEIATHTSAVSVSLTRQLLWRGLVEDHPMGSHRLETALIGYTSAGADAREGVASFVEKRPAAFTGRVPGDLPEGWPFWTEPAFADAPDVHADAVPGDD